MAVATAETRICKTCKGTGFRFNYCYVDNGRCWKCDGQGFVKLGTSEETGVQVYRSYRRKSQARVTITTTYIVRNQGGNMQRVVRFHVDGVDAEGQVWSRDFDGALYDAFMQKLFASDITTPVRG